MQHIPYTNPDDVERDKKAMEAFTTEKPVWPDLALSGEDIHAVFCIVDPDQRVAWEEVPDFCRPLYEDFAKELNRIIAARQAWFEGEDRTISAVRCPRCGGMFTNFKLKEHPCL